MENNISSHLTLPFFSTSSCYALTTMWLISLLSPHVPIAWQISFFHLQIWKNFIWNFGSCLKCTSLVNPSNMCFVLLFALTSEKPDRQTNQQLEESCIWTRSTCIIAGWIPVLGHKIDIRWVHQRYTRQCQIRVRFESRVSQIFKALGKRFWLSKYVPIIIVCCIEKGFYKRFNWSPVLGVFTNGLITWHSTYLY